MDLLNLLVQMVDEQAVAIESYNENQERDLIYKGVVGGLFKVAGGSRPSYEKLKGFLVVRLSADRDGCITIAVEKAENGGYRINVPISTEEKEMLLGKKD